MFRKKKYVLFLVVALSLVILYLGLSFFIASQITNPVARHIDLSPVFVSNEYQNVSFKTSDGLTLKGWLFNPTAEKFIIFVPGILDNRTNQGYYGVSLTRELLDNNFGVLMYDPRARGESDGKTRLKNEFLDVVSAINFLESNGVKKKNVYILAYSTGARAALLALPKINNIGGVIVDSTPTDLKSVITHVVTVEQGLPGFILPGVYFWLDLTGLDIDSKNILNNVSKTRNPILVIHAKNDLSVSVKNSEDIIAANKNNTLVIFPNGSHIEAYKFNPNMYRKTIFDFLNK